MRDIIWKICFLGSNTEQLSVLNIELYVVTYRIIYDIINVSRKRSKRKMCTRIKMELLQIWIKRVIFHVRLSSWAVYKFQ